MPPHSLLSSQHSNGLLGRLAGRNDCRPPCHRESGLREVGLGAVLRHKGQIVAFVHHAWVAEDFPPKFGVLIGDPAWQTFFELLAIALALDLWGSWFRKEPCAVIGDNTGSLTNLLHQKGKGPQLHIAKELAWRRARHDWLISVGHLPTEGNKVQDQLSRLAEGTAFPSEALTNAIESELAPVGQFWRCLIDL